MTDPRPLAPYRVAPSSPEAVVRYGPFPTAWWKLAVAPALCFGAFFLDGMADVRTRVDCTLARCHLSVRGWRRPPRVLRGGPGLIEDAIIGDRVRTKKGGWKARVHIRLAGGRRLRLDSVPIDQAQRQVAQVAAFISRRRPSFRYDSGDRRWLRPLAWALYAAALLLVLDALRRRRAHRLRVGQGVVTVEEPGRFRTLPPRQVLCDGASDVAVRWTQVRARGPKTAAAYAATLELCFPDGRTEPLTTRPREGLGCHYQAAADLREALRLPARGPIASPFPELALPGYRPGLASTPLTSLWLGGTCGLLAGMALYGVVLILRDPAALDWAVDPGAFVAGGGLALALASLLVAIGLARRRDRRRYEALSGTGAD